MFSFRLAILIAIASLFLGCLSLGEYAVKYRASSEAGVGVTSSTALLKSGRETLLATAEAENQNRLKEQLRCEYFRNQLVVAAEDAQTHRLGVWLYPWYWPLHL